MSLNVHLLCFDTEVGRRYIDERFTALALLIGNPEPLEKFKTTPFVEAFEQVFGVKLSYRGMQFGEFEMIDWLAHYCRWYKENQP